MLASLNNYNKINHKNIDPAVDQIEMAAKQRRSRGELKPLNQKEFMSNDEMIKGANKKVEESK